LKASRPSAWKRTTFSPADLGRLRTALADASQKVHPFNPALRWLVRRLMEEAGNYPANPHRTEAAIALRALICAVLVEAMRQILVPPTEPKEIVAAAITYLQKHLSEPLHMDDLVRHLGFSRSRMFDVFKEQTGLTPNDYLLRLRVEEAQEQLSLTDRSVTDIAMATGFSSGQYFSTVFARYAGISPTDFRKGAKPRGRSRLRLAAR
jgi:AraC-like DNA-binding protein